MHKPTTKAVLAAAGLDTPAWITLDGRSPHERAIEVGDVLGYPAFVKPCQGGGSLGAGVVRTEEDLVRRLVAAIDGPYHSYMVEELITGQVCSVGLLEVNGRLTPLPVYEVETQREFIDYVAKHDPRERVEKCPSSLPSLLTVEMQRQALLAHSVIGAYGVSRVDAHTRPVGLA